MVNIAISNPGAPAAPAAPPAGDAKPKRERKTRKDFADLKSFHEFKLTEAKGALERAQAKVTLWTNKIANPGVTDVAKQEKKVAKLTSALGALAKSNPAILAGLQKSDPAAYAAIQALLGATAAATA